MMANCSMRYSLSKKLFLHVVYTGIFDKFIIITARCYAERGYGTVCPSVCDAQVP